MKTVEYYLSKGFDQRAAAYYAGGRRQLVDVAANDDYTLTLRFDNGELRLYDLRPSIRAGGVFLPLRDLAVFRRVYLDQRHCVAWDLDPDVDSNVVWSNKIDLCADSCYVDSTKVQESDVFS